MDVSDGRFNTDDSTIFDIVHLMFLGVGRNNNN